MMARIGTVEPPKGLLGKAAEAQRRAAGRVSLEEVADARARFVAATEAVRKAEKANDFKQSIALALGVQTDAAEDLDQALEEQIQIAEAHLIDGAADGRRGFRLAPAGTTVLAVVAAGLVLVGLQPRIKEYR
jgi:hypothetical protein